MVQERRVVEGVEGDWSHERSARALSARGLGEKRGGVGDVREKTVEELVARDEVRLAVELDERGAHAARRARAAARREHLHADETLPCDAVRELRDFGGAGGSAIGVEPGKGSVEIVVAGSERFAGLGERNAFRDLAKLSDEFDRRLHRRCCRVQSRGQRGSSADGVHGVDEGEEVEQAMTRATGTRNFARLCHVPAYIR